MSDEITAEFFKLSRSREIAVARLSDGALGIDIKSEFGETNFSLSPEAAYSLWLLLTIRLDMNKDRSEFVKHLIYKETQDV